MTPSATKNGAGAQLLAGSGIPASHFGLAENNSSGIELGMQVIYRPGPTVTTADTYDDGVLHFNVNTGPQSTANGSSSNNAARAAWSFDYSIAAGLQRPAGQSGQLHVQAPAPTSIQASAPAITPCSSFPTAASTRARATPATSGLIPIVNASGPGTINGHPIVIGDDAGSATVTQNSENYAFSFVQNYLTGVYGPANSFNGPAHFDLDLQAFQGSTLLADNHIVVDVNAPLPPPAPMSVSGFTTLDDPALSNVQALGINDAGVIVGQGDLDANHQRGWSYDGANYTTISAFGAQDTSAHAINDLGVIVGDYSPSRSTPRYGFSDANNTFTSIVSDSPYPSTNANGNNDAGVVVGSDYLHSGARYSGYIDDNGSFTYLNAPGANNPLGDTFANDINNSGQIVGTFNTNASVQSGYQGFLYQDGTYTAFADPLAVLGTFAQGINDAGQIVGWYNDAANKSHGFIDNDGAFTTVDEPLGVNGTVINGINNAGQIVGYYIDGSNHDHAFVATINNPVGQSTNDVLVASPQGSTLTGGAGNDTFVFNQAALTPSTITDFTHGQDMLQISAAGFDHGLVSGGNPELYTGTLASAMGSGSNGYFIFDNSNPGGGTLYWDANGGSGADATAIATLTHVTTLLQSDFHLL